MRARQLPGWDPRSREGRCEIRVWVDNRAEVRMRGDSIFVRTLEGSKGRDEGSQCSQPFPYNSVRGFAIHQTAGRNRVTLSQEPSRANNYTAVMTIEDAQGGGDNYAFEATWRADDVATSPAPFFDEVRACQEVVRQRFLRQNGPSAYIDFAGYPEQFRGARLQQNDGRQDRREDRVRSGQDSIQGRGTAKSASETRELTYACMVDPRQNRITAGSYQFERGGLRVNDGPSDRRSLR